MMNVSSNSYGFLVYYCIKYMKLGEMILAMEDLVELPIGIMSYINEVYLDTLE